jgi:non-canonical purine NTP pyrophosphatase (RdgB/HAM1 family)
MIKNLTFITGNPAKAEQLSRYFKMPIQHQKIDLPEIQSLNLEEVVTCKAKEAYKEIKKPVLVEDVSLTFSALGRLPGPLIKWFLKELDLSGLSKLLNGYKDRSAVAEVMFGLYDGKKMTLFKGARKGSIALTPKGKSGFGWDPVFIPEGYSQTWAEMSETDINKTSMRKIALKKLEKYLKG